MQTKIIHIDYFGEREIFVNLPVGTRLVEHKERCCSRRPKRIVITDTHGETHVVRYITKSGKDDSRMMNSGEAEHIETRQWKIG